MKSTFCLTLVLSLIPLAVATAQPVQSGRMPERRVNIATQKADSALADVDATATDSQFSLAQIQSLIADLKGGSLTPAPNADEASKAAVAERKNRLVSALQAMSPGEAKPTEATTGKFLTELQAGLKPTLDTIPTDLSSLANGSAGGVSQGDLMSQFSAAIADPQASMAKLENVQGLFTQVQTLMSNPSMTPADLTANMDTVTKILTDLKVAPESTTKIVSSLQSMIGESAALLPK